MTPSTKNYIRAFCMTLLLLISAGARIAFAQDPGTPGALAVTREEYNFGDAAFQPTNFPGPVELRASIHYPTNLPGGPYPVIVFLHGRHATCFRGGSALLQWPCASGSQPIPSYQGYDYVSQVLASHGYVVVSVSANGVNAVDNSVNDLGALARTELMQEHLDILNGFNTRGGAPFGTKFVGKFNMSQIGTMGHSRGGEGVVRHYVLNNDLGAPYGIKAVFPLAPVNFSCLTATATSTICKASIFTMTLVTTSPVISRLNTTFWSWARTTISTTLSGRLRVLFPAPQMTGLYSFRAAVRIRSAAPVATVED